jgi:hypothetical protein
VQKSPKAKHDMGVEVIGIIVLDVV